MLIPFETLGVRPTGILHVGAHYGEEAEAYSKICNGPVVWIEALPDAYHKLLRHISNFPGHTAIHACVSNVTGAQVEFNVANNEGQSSSLLPFKEHAIVHPEVKYTGVCKLTTTRIDDIDYDFSGLDFLNMDLQGAELLALEGMGDMIDQFNYAYLEVNWRELYEGCPLIGDITDFMKSKGFFMEKAHQCGNTGWGDAFFRR